MASISHGEHGRRLIQFKRADGLRKSIRLGKLSKKAAETVKLHVEHLAYAAMTRTSPPDETATWVASLDAVMHKKLVKAGLATPRNDERQGVKLGAFIDQYIGIRADVKPATAIVFGNVRRNLIEYFGAEKAIRDITAGDADEWRLWLINDQTLADNTCRRRTGIARQFFRAAVRKRLLDANPFMDLPGTVRENAKRLYFVTRNEATKVLEHCPDAEWRLLFALSRFAALRCPSEHLSLRWSDVDWARSRMTVRSPKTEHHVGGESRIVPIFPELLPYLREVFEAAEPGTEYVIARYRDTKKNFRTRLERIIKRAGLKPWPKLWHNLRSTRQTELSERWPMHVICKWVGNSQPIAARHYLQVTDAHFEQAAAASSGAPSALQNPMQPVAELPGTDAPDDKIGDAAESEKPAVATTIRDDSDEFASVHGNPRHERVGVTGLEPVTSSV